MVFQSLNEANFKSHIDMIGKSLVSLEEDEEDFKLDVFRLLRCSVQKHKDVGSDTLLKLTHKLLKGEGSIKLKSFLLDFLREMTTKETLPSLLEDLIGVLDQTSMEAFGIKLIETLSSMLVDMHAIVRLNATTKDHLMHSFLKSVFNRILFGSALVKQAAVGALSRLAIHLSAYNDRITALQKSMYLSTDDA